MKNKRKISKTFFILSFLPYIILVLISSYYAIFGNDIYAFMGGYIRTDYGMTAFLDTLTWNCLILTFIPILPISLIYQIIYILIYIYKRISKKHLNKITKRTNNKL